MIPQSVQDAFDVRFYRWSLADAEREFAANFPLMRIVSDPGAQGTLQYLERLTPDERKSLMTAAVRRANPRALELLGESFSIHEQQILNVYRDNVMPIIGKFMDQVATRRYLSADKTTRPRKKRLARPVKEKLRACCGQIIFYDSASLWTHSTMIAGWEIRTAIDMGGNYDLRYWQSIHQPSEGESLRHAITLHSWLGFAQTEWWLSHESEEGAAAKAIETLCRHFMAAAPEFLPSFPES